MKPPTTTSSHYRVPLLRLVVRFLLLVAICSDLASGGDDSSGPIPKGVIELDAMSFDASINEGNHVWLIEFYAPWCGHCKRFAATYEEVAKELHSLPASSSSEDGQGDADADADGNDGGGGGGGGGRSDGRRVMVAKVDGAADRALSSRFNVGGFPTFYLVDGWSVYQYEGRRSKEKLVEFAVEGYKDDEPIPFLNSPFGPMGQLRAAMMYCGTKVVLGYESLVDRGYSKGAAAVMMCLGGITLGLVSIIAVGLMTVPKPKED